MSLTQVQFDRLTLYTRLIEEIGLARSESEVFQIAARYVSDVLEVDRCSIALLDDSGEFLDIVGLNGEEGAAPVGERITRAGSLLGEALDKQEVVVENHSKPSRFEDLTQTRATGTSSMVAPLISGGRLLGTLNTLRKYPRTYSESCRILIQQVAGLLASNIEARRLFEQTKRSLEKAEEFAYQQTKLYEMAGLLEQASSLYEMRDIVSSTIKAISNTSHVCITLFDESIQAFDVYADVGCPFIDDFSLNPFNSLAGKVLRENKAIYIADIHTEKAEEYQEVRLMRRLGLQCLLVTPLFRESKAIGSINIASDIPAGYDREKQKLLNHISSYLSVSIDNLRKNGELSRRADELSKTNEELVKANKVKSQFLANMSHEIRTPMNGVIGMASMLNSTELSAVQTDYVDIIRTSGEALLSIINDILDFSKIEANKLVIEEHFFDLHTCIGEAMDTVTPAASNKGIELLYYIDANVLPVIKSDSVRLKQILTNLLSNAIKFTEKGEVFISVSSQPIDDNLYGFTFSVMDTGIGIPADRVASLFDAFSQVDVSTTRKYGGTGLGLAISAQLAQKLGGQINVESEVGVGSTFTLTIKAPATQSEFVNDVALFKDKSVLIVDDNETNRRILASQLETWGVETLAVASGAEALVEINQNRHFDLALLDYQMPEMDGLMLAQTLKNHNFASAIPLIMISSIGDRQPHSENLIASWMTKPVKPVHLLNAMSRALGQKEIKGPQKSKPVEAPNLSSIRVLLAEDNKINQKVALSMLEQFQIDADVVENGLDVLKAMEHMQYDLIFMDMMMPELDGLDTTEQIRQSEHFKQPKIIALTANAMEEDKTRCLLAGMDDFLAKPFKLQMLQEMLVKWATPLAGTIPVPT